MLTIVISEVDLNLCAIDLAAKRKNLTRNYKKILLCSCAILYYLHTIIC